MKFYDVAAYIFFVRETEHVQLGAIGPENDAIRAEPVHGDTGIFHEVAKFSFDAPRSFFGAFGLGNVKEHVQAVRPGRREDAVGLRFGESALAGFAARYLLVTGGGNHMPIDVWMLEGARVSVHDFAHLLVIALLQRVTAKRDNAPALQTLGQGLLVLHEGRPIVRLEKARIPADAKAVVALSERSLFLLKPKGDHVESLQLARLPVPLVEVEHAQRTRPDGIVDAGMRDAKQRSRLPRGQRRRGDPETALVGTQSRDKKGYQRRDELVAVAIEMASVRPERNVLNSRQAAARERRVLCQGHRKTSWVLVTRTQVQPVSLQTRSSPDPGAP